MANLTVSIHGTESYENYKRSLDLETAVHTTTYSVGEANYETSVHQYLQSSHVLLTLLKVTILFIPRPSLCVPHQIEQATPCCYNRNG